MAEKDQAKGRELLSKLVAVNRYWLGSPPKQIKSNAYDFQLKDKPKQRISIGTDSNFVPVDDGHQVPLRIQIDKMQSNTENRKDHRHRLHDLDLEAGRRAAICFTVFQGPRTR